MEYVAPLPNETLEWLRSLNRSEESTYKAAAADPLPQSHHTQLVDGSYSTYEEAAAAGYSVVPPMPFTAPASASDLREQGVFSQYRLPQHPESA